MNNITTGGWVALVILLIIGIAYPTFGVTVLVLIVAWIWWTKYSSHAKEKQKQEAKRQAELQAQREQNIAKYEAVDLPATAFKDDIIHLQPKEWIYYANSDTPITWSELRSKTTRINYSGPTASFKIVKGVRWRMGSLKTDIQQSNYWKQIFVGYVLLTNRRIVLYNPNDHSAKSFRYTNLLTTNAFIDGVMLSTNAGKQIMLSGFNNADEFNVYLHRLLTEDDVMPQK